MPVRVTQTMLNNNMMRNLSNSMGRMDKLQEQISSGRKISRPSDDPVIAIRGMVYRSVLTQNEQYQRNVDETRAWMDSSDEALDEITTVLHRVKELMVQAGGVLPKESKVSIGQEILQLRDHLGSIANKTIGGRYIFAGTDTDTAPYDQAANQFVNKNDSDIVLELSKSIYIPVNVRGVDVFTYPNQTDNIFKLLTDMGNDLLAGQNVSSYSSKLEDQTSNVLMIRSDLGARINRLDLIDQRLKAESVSTTKLMSDNEDVDEAEVITKLKTQENVHRAALGIGARIIQPSLIDFLR